MKNVQYFTMLYLEHYPYMCTVTVLLTFYLTSYPVLTNIVIDEELDFISKNLCETHVSKHVTSCEQYQVQDEENEVYEEQYQSGT